MAEFDNLQPVSPRFFSAIEGDPRISAAAKSALVDRALGGRLELEEVRSRMVESRQRERLNNIRIQSEEFQLAEARRRAQEDVDKKAAAGALHGEFESVITDDTLTNEDKHKALAELRFKNSSAFTDSPFLRDKYDAAKGMLAPPVTAAQKLAAERESRMQQQAAAAAAEKARLEKKKDIKEAAAQDLEFLNTAYGDLDRAKFKEIEDQIRGKLPTDDFENPTARPTAMAFIESYGTPSDVAAAQSVSDRDLLALAATIKARVFRNLSDQRALADRDTSSVDFLGIPSE